MKKLLLLISFVACLLGLAQGVYAQTYPNKPVRMIIPFSVGGSTDILARVIGQKLSENLGQQVVIENKGGANGLIGMDWQSLLLMVTPFYFVQRAPYLSIRLYIKAACLMTLIKLLQK